MWEWEEEEEELLDSEAASGGSVVGRLTEISWLSLALPTLQPASRYFSSITSFIKKSFFSFCGMQICVLWRNLKFLEQKKINKANVWSRVIGGPRQVT